MREVFLFIPDFNGGGAERALLNLLTHWPTELSGHWRPVVIVRQYSGSLCDQVPSNIEVVSLQLPSSGLWTSMISVAKLGALLRRRRPDLIVAFLSLPSIALARRLASHSTTMVASVQNPVPQSVLRSPVRRLIYAWICRQVDFFWAISPGIGQEIQSVFAVTEHQVKVLPNSVDLKQVISGRDVTVDHPAFLSHLVPVVTTACRLVPQKRVDVLLKAASHLAPQIQFNLVILGEGAQHAYLKQLASDLGIGARTFFLGFQPNPWKFISKSSVFALASDFEGFGNVLIEAMACGVPVVTTRAPFGPEYILSGCDCGLLVPTGDPIALAEGLQRMLSDEELRRHCVGGGFKRAADFDIGQISQTFAELILQAADHG